jgi:cytoskeletal protein RodZ
MGNILLPLGIIVGISILSWIFQQVQKASEEQRRKQQQQQQQQAAPPVVRRAGPKTGGSDIDRFLQEIDKLRAGGKPPPKVAPKPVPPPPKLAPQAKKIRLGDQAAPSFKTTAAPVAASVPARIVVPAGTGAADDDLPVATVVGQDRSSAILSAGVSVATIATIVRPTDAGFRVAKSPIATKVAELLSRPESAAVAVALNEILGPPKCKRRG